MSIQTSRNVSKEYLQSLSYLKDKNNFWEMRWLIGSAPDFWVRDSGFEFDIYHNDPDAQQDHCVINNTEEILRV